MVIKMETYSIDEVINYLSLHKIFSAKSASRSNKKFHNMKVYAEYSAYQLWMKYIDNLACVNCQRKANFFKLHKHQEIKDVYFFQLYCLDQNMSAILMTKDHIIPKSKGGKNNIDNYQLFCRICNKAKRDFDPESLECLEKLANIRRNVKN